MYVLLLYSSYGQNIRQSGILQRKTLCKYCLLQEPWERITVVTVVVSTLLITISKIINLATALNLTISK